MMTRGIAIASVVSTACTHAPPPPPPAGDRLPTAADVLERSVLAIGGDALRRHRSMTMHGTFRVPAKHVEIEDAQWSSGVRQVQRSTLSDHRVAWSGYDGTVAWEIDTGGVVTIFHGDMVKTIARDADMYYHLHVLDYFKSMAVVDIQSFAGHRCYHLRGINNWNKVNEQFYDVASGLLVGYAFNTAWRGGNGAATEMFDGYRDFGGGLVATLTTSRDGDELSTFTITSITYDDVDDAVFALPEPVRAQLAAERKP